MKVLLLISLGLVLCAGGSTAQSVDRQDDRQPFGIYVTGGGAFIASPSDLSSSYLPGLGGGFRAGLRFDNRYEFLLGVELLSFGYDGTLENADGGAFKPLLYAGEAKYYFGPPRPGSMRLFGTAGLGLISLSYNDIRRDGIAVQTRETETRLMVEFGGGADIELSDQATLTMYGRIVVFDAGSEVGVLLPIMVGFRFAP